MNAHHLGAEAAAPLTPDEIAMVAQHRNDECDCIMPAPAEAGPLPVFKKNGREADHAFEYRGSDGGLLGYVLRWDARDGHRKEFSPATCWGDGGGKASWQLKTWPGKRPLFGLDQLAARPDAIVLLVEGEKKVRAVERGPLADAFTWAKHPVIGISWPGGSNAVKHADFSPLAGRDVIVLPDNDQPGEAAADALVDVLGKVGLKRLRRWKPPVEFPIKWDIADELPDGAAAPEALVNSMIEAPEIKAQSGPESLSLGEWDAGSDRELPPPRGWLLGSVFCRQFVSSLLGDGGVGKTALRYAQLISLAIGRSLTGEHVFQRCRVLIVSLEDGVDELRRRIKAVLIHHEIELSELEGWLFLASPGAAGGKLMALDQHGRPAIGGLAQKLAHTIATRRVDIVSLDPFVKTHSVEENSNSAIDDVIQILSDLSIKHDMAVDIPHHMSKGTPEPGNANRGRGASAAKDGGRLVYTLTPMSTEEAKTFGLSETERRRRVRMDSGKVNIAPHAGKATWFRLVGVPLGNGTALYPNGDEVQTVEPWTPPEIWGGLSNEHLNAALTDIDAGMPNGQRYSDAARAPTRAAWPIIMRHCSDRTEPQCREILKTWVKNGVLYNEDYDDPVDRKSRKGLRLNPAKRPG